MRSRVLLAAASGLLGLALAGCGAGQDAPTAAMLASIPGVSADDAGVSVRNVHVPFDPEGYPPGADAPVQLVIVNQGTGPVQLVDLTSPAAGSLTLVSAVQVGRAGPPGETAEPPNGGAGQLLVAPQAMVEVTLLAAGLAEPLDGTRSLPVLLTFDNGAAFSLEVPTAPPLAPLPREPMILDEDENH